MIAVVRRNILLVLAVMLTLSIVSCAAGGGSNVSRKVDALDRDLEDVRAFQAEQTTQIASLQREISKLRGSLEEIQHHSARASLNAGGVNRQGMQGYAGPDGMDRGAGNQQNMAAGDYVAPGAAKLPEQPKLPNTNIVSPPPAIVPREFVSKDIQLAKTIPGRNGQMLKTSIEQVSEGRFAQAMPTLEELRDLSYGVDWGAIVLFWLGVSAEGKLQNKKAISFYHELVTTYPKHERTSVAMLRQGSVMIRERDTQTAKLVFQKLITDFPNSDAARKAQERLRDL